MVCKMDYIFNEYEVDVEDWLCLDCPNKNFCDNFKLYVDEEKLKSRKQKTVYHNEIEFRGRYADALLKLLDKQEVTMHDFYSGSYEPTSKLNRFMTKLDQAGIKYAKGGNSLRTTVLNIKK